MTASDLGPTVLPESVVWKVTVTQVNSGGDDDDSNIYIRFTDDGYKFDGLQRELSELYLSHDTPKLWNPRAGDLGVYVSDWSGRIERIRVLTSDPYGNAERI